MPTLQDAKDYLGIDYTDAATDRRVTQTISVAERFLEGSLGVGFPQDDPRVKELALIVIGDLYDNHSMTEKLSHTTRKIVQDFSLQIRLDMRTGGGGQ